MSINKLIFLVLLFGGCSIFAAEPEVEKVDLQHEELVNKFKYPGTLLEAMVLHEDAHRYFLIPTWKIALKHLSGELKYIEHCLKNPWPSKSKIANMNEKQLSVLRQKIINFVQKFLPRALSEEDDSEDSSLGFSFNNKTTPEKWSTLKRKHKTRKNLGFNLRGNQKTSNKHAPRLNRKNTFFASKSTGKLSISKEGCKKKVENICLNVSDILLADVKNCQSLMVKHNKGKYWSKLKNKKKISELTAAINALEKIYKHVRKHESDDLFMKIIGEPKTKEIFINFVLSSANREMLTKFLDKFFPANKKKGYFSSLRRVCVMNRTDWIKNKLERYFSSDNEDFEAKIANFWVQIFHSDSH